MNFKAAGIDIGYLYSKVVALDAAGRTVHTSYEAHNGDYAGTLRRQLRPLAETGNVPIVLSGQETRRWQKEGGGCWLHEAQALTLAVRGLPQPARAIIHVGASGVSMVELDDEGNLAGYATNTLCAAGTGSFLDEQAERLDVSYQSPPTLEQGAKIPVIATRCTVFAKSDLIHSQQEGYSKAAMWVGLCQGMTSTLFQTLLKGRDLPGFTVMTGGVSRNSFVLASAQERFPGRVAPMPDGELAVAYGAAVHGLATGAGLTLEQLEDRLRSAPREDSAKDETCPPLLLHKSFYPSFIVDHEYLDEQGNEVRITRLAPGEKLSGYVGLDVGSTSTKLALIDEEGQVRCDIYRRTGGEPIEAGRKVLQALAALLEERAALVEIRGLATTGSGRKLVGMVFGADVIINEITAHARGAIAAADGDVETVFEIGGQDAKYIRLHKGQIRDSNMNFVCSAGTGSFVEEQARKLNFKVTEIGPASKGIEPPATSDRCTVFMEQDVAKLLAEGCSREEAMGGVLYSVIKNYLNKVVGNRPVSRERVVFQGATARNFGLVAALEKLLDVEVVVSPYCHVMGCIGAARLALERRRGDSSFIGFSNLERSIEISHGRCDLCTNNCRITHAGGDGGDEETSWGYMCGREPNGPALPMTHDRGFRLLDGMMRRAVKRTNDAATADAPVIGLPRSLSTYGLAPFWTGFCESLGLRLKVGPETDDDTKEAGNALAAADFCFPVKAHLGHVRRVLEDPDSDFSLVPYFISDTPNQHTSASLLCPYVESSPSVYRALGDETDERLLAPTLDFRWSKDKQARELSTWFKRVIPGVSVGKLKAALTAGHDSHRRFAEDAVTAGSKLLAAIRAAGDKAFVFVGRPYNVRDQGLNLGIPRHFARLGAHVLPLEMLPYRPELLADDFRNVFWAYGQRILSALRQVGESEDIFPVYLSNFNCGPDSFLLTYAEEMLKDKPFLVLELDEHGTEGGYLTRIEAFLDVVDGVGEATSKRKLTFPEHHIDEFKGRKMWLPPLHPVIARLFAAAMRAEGRDAEMMPLEDVASFERGRQVTRGSECLPTCTTIGRFLNILEERDLDPSKQALLMATADGPCRFGQYALLHRTILDREGYGDIPILSPSSFNSYQGVGESLRRAAWRLFLIGDMLFKARCKVAPYETVPGAAERALEESIVEFETAVEAGVPIKPVLESAMDRFAAVEVAGAKKPLVGIVGEIYVRCNPFTNDYLVESIERFGGEAWLAPASEWFLYTAKYQGWAAREGMSGMRARAASVLKNRFMARDEKAWYAAAGPFMADRHEPPIEEVLQAGRRFIPMNFAGEAIITVGRAIKFAREGADMVVNAAPFGCMPGTLTTAILAKIQEEEGVPNVGMFYDGTPGLNKVLEPYINGLKQTPSAAIRHEAR